MALHFYKILLFLVLPILWFNKVGSSNIEFRENKIIHEIEVNHAGNDSDDKTPLNLIEVQNDKGQSVEFYADVESVICLEEVCKVVAVRLYWDNLGTYKNYELAKGETLEKYEADVFDKNDYKKLNNILANENSPYKEVRIDEILTVVDDAHLEEDVDAVSGATALILPDEDTVHGAALTCFTLWHWAHSEINQMIRDISGANLAERQVEAYIKSSETEYQLFALEQAAKNKIYSQPVVEMIMDKASKNDKLLKAVIKYLEQADASIYFKNIETYFLKGDKKQRIAALTSLLNTNYKAPIDYFTTFSFNTSKLEYFQEVSIFLRLMKLKSSNNSEVTNQVFILLKKDLLIARTAYWFLKDRTLNTNQSKVLDKFYSKYKDQL